MWTGDIRQGILEEFAEAAGRRTAWGNLLFEDNEALSLAQAIPVPDRSPGQTFLDGDAEGAVSEARANMASYARARQETSGSAGGGVRIVLSTTIKAALNTRTFKDRSCQALADKLGISRSTLYRRAREERLLLTYKKHAAREDAIRAAMISAGGSQTDAAKALGMSLSALHYWVRKWDVPRAPHGGDPRQRKQPSKKDTVAP